MVDFLLRDPGSEFEIIDELAKLRVINELVVVLVVFLKDVVHSTLHYLLH